MMCWYMLAKPGLRHGKAVCLVRSFGCWISGYYILALDGRLETWPPGLTSQSSRIDKEMMWWVDSTNNL
jgi:hypothetical protein